MKTLYKLTDQNMQTYDDFQYVLGQKAEAKGYGRGLCTAGLLHAYEHPFLAVLHNPIHADYKSPRLFRAVTSSRIVREGYMKCGAKSLILLEEIPLPVVTTEQRIKYAIFCALAVYKDPNFSKWANDWLSGKDRFAEAAWAAAWAAAAARAAWAAARAARVAVARADIDLIALAERAML